MKTVALVCILLVHASASAPFRKFAIREKRIPRNNGQPRNVVAKSYVAESFPFPMDAFSPSSTVVPAPIHKYEWKGISDSYKEDQSEAYSDNWGEFQSASHDLEGLGDDSDRESLISRLTDDLEEAQELSDNDELTFDLELDDGKGSKLEEFGRETADESDSASEKEDAAEQKEAQEDEEEEFYEITEEMDLNQPSEPHADSRLLEVLGPASKYMFEALTRSPSEVLRRSALTPLIDKSPTTSSYDSPPPSPSPPTIVVNKHCTNSTEFYLTKREAERLNLHSN